MRKWLATLGASLAIGLAGCDNAPDTKNVEAQAPAITASAPVNKTIDTTQIQVVKACDKQDIQTPTVYKEKYAEDFQKWLSSCDPMVQKMVKSTQKWKDYAPSGHYSLLTDVVLEAQKTFEALSKLPPEAQTLVKASQKWKDYAPSGHYSLLTDSIGQIKSILALLEKNPELGSKLTGWTMIVKKDELYKYGIYSSGVESAEVRIPTVEDIRNMRWELWVALALLQAKK
jgi:hypothetical protein